MSFHPTAGYWLPLSEAQALAHQGNKVRLPAPLSQLPRSATQYYDILKGPLVSQDNQHTFRTMPLLKADLERRWLAHLEAQAAAPHLRE